MINYWSYFKVSSKTFWNNDKNNNQLISYYSQNDFLFYHIQTTEASIKKIIGINKYENVNVTRITHLYIKNL